MIQESANDSADSETPNITTMGQRLTPKDLTLLSTASRVGATHSLPLEKFEETLSAQTGSTTNRPEPKPFLQTDFRRRRLTTGFR